MTLPNIFTAEVSQKVINRINQLDSHSQPQWGKMNVAQMSLYGNRNKGHFDYFIDDFSHVPP